MQEIRHREARHPPTQANRMQNLLHLCNERGDSGPDEGVGRPRIRFVHDVLGIRQ
jgi:hypothetical protein